MATLYPYDANLVLHDGTQKTASFTGSVASFDTGGQYRFPAVAVLQVTTLDFTTGDETYDIIIEGSNSSTFASGNVQLGSIALGLGSHLVAGRYTILFDNDQGGTVYQYIRLRGVLGGTTPILSMNAFMATLEPLC